MGWVKAHIGRERNEMADRATKEYIKKNAKSKSGLPRSYIKSILRQEAVDRLQEHWDDDSTRGRTLHAYTCTKSWLLSHP